MKFQILDDESKRNHAGSKAPNDVAKIAENMGFVTFKIDVTDLGNNYVKKIGRQFINYRNWQSIYRKIPKGSVLLIQFPSYHFELNRNRVLKSLKFKKKVKFVFLIHDLNILRGEKEDPKYDLMLELADKIIVHNYRMQQYLIEKGISASKLINLQIFDYLCKIDKSKQIKYKKKIIIAGNLDINKSGYLRYLNKIPVNFDLFGPNFTLSNISNVSYEGSYTADKIMSKLAYGYGLIWDGNEINTCSGNYGNYLMYNDPHKLSLYIVSGIPIIIWKKAAEAKFVLDNNIGIAIDSLNDLPNVIERTTRDDYYRYCQNIKKVAYNLSHGKYTEFALAKALKDLANTNNY